MHVLTQNTLTLFSGVIQSVQLNETKNLVAESVVMHFASHGLHVLMIDVSDNN